MMPNEIISYLEMSRREGASLQRGMNFGLAMKAAAAPKKGGRMLVGIAVTTFHHPITKTTRRVDRRSTHSYCPGQHDPVR
jgi:hypothetical protein